MLGEVSACDGGRLGVDLGVQEQEIARSTLNGARVGGNLGSVLVLHDTQFERVFLVDTSGVSGNGSGVCLHVVDCMVFYVEG